MLGKFKKIVLYVLLSMFFCIIMGTNTYASGEKIESAKITLSCGDAPKVNEPPGEITADTTDEEFFVEQAEFTNEIEVWKLGDRPEVTISLIAENDYRFSYTSSSHFKISGCGAEFKRAKIYDGGNRLILEVYLKRVEGKPEIIEDLEWSSSYGMWEELEEDIKQYEVRLYRNKKIIDTVTTTDTVFDFRNYISQEGDYTFRVRGIARYENRAGNWSEHSEENTFTKYAAANYGKGNWIQDQHGWWYRYQNGEYPISSWKAINNSWYYFNHDGYMLTGWQFIKDRWYYLNPSGAMMTGWQFINGFWYYLSAEGSMMSGWQLINSQWYYLNESGLMLTGWQLISGRWYYFHSDGTMLSGWQFINGFWYYLSNSGYMLSNWQYIDNHWYYLNASGMMLTDWQYINDLWYYLGKDGIMYANQATPDGYYVDNNGVWNH